MKRFGCMGCGCDIDGGNCDILQYPNFPKIQYYKIGCPAFIYDC